MRMKRIVYMLFCLPVFLLLPVTMKAQTTCSSLDFTIASTTVTPSTCLSNGSITVTISNTTSNVSGLQYGLTSENGLVINPQPSNTFLNLPSGIYTISVRAFCEYDANYSVVKTADKVVVGGTYKVPQASFNPGSSRKSYSGSCGTGIIALNVTDGSGSFAFNIVSAPAGVTLGPVTPTKNGTVYTLPGQNWPAGDYQISVDDGCYIAMANFTLNALSGFPVFWSESYQGFRPDLNNTKNSCNYVGWYAYSYDLVSSQSTYNSDYLTYFNTGMYEIGMAPAGTDVSGVTNWATWTTNVTSTTIPTSYMYFDLSPKSIKDFYSTSYTSAQLLTVFLRVKGCPTTYKSFTTSIRPPITSSAIQTPTVNCTSITAKAWYDYDGVFCYPLTLTIKTAADSLMYQKTGWVYNTDNATPIPVDYDKGPYTITFTDPDGTLASYSVNPAYTNYFYTTPYCSYYLPFFRVYNLTGAKPGSCYQWAGIVTVTDQATGALIGRDTVFNNNSVLLSNIQMEYNNNYTVVVQYPNGTSDTTTSNLTSAPTPTLTVSTALTTTPYCFVNYGSLYVNASSAGYWPIGTTFSVTGPAGYTPQSFTSTSLGSYTYYFPLTTLPPGQYTLTYDWGGGGCPRTVTFNNPGVYNYSNFSYTSERTCSGLKITPTGNMTYQGNNTTTYFRLTGGPSGYDNSVISPGGSITLSAPGTYTLGIMNISSSTGCAIATQTINYTADPLSLDPNFTSAYVCVGSDIGDISVKAINGVTPYMYELWNADNTVQEIGKTSSDGSIHFEYGGINETYTVRVSDACGNSFNQQVTLSDLLTARIVYSPDNTVCQGETIQLDCITLGTTEYTWTGPNGYTSTEQNPAIPNAQSNMTGWYKVEVTPEFCGSSVKDSTYVTVIALTAGDAVENQEVCVMTKPAVLSSEVTGGSGNYTYQWQLKADDATGWTDIPGATEATYQPPVQRKSGTVYFRRMTTDTNCNATVSGNPITVVVKGCYVPVNPNVRSLTQ